VPFVAQGIDGRSASYTTVEAAAQKVESIPIPGMKAFPESITSTTDGTLYVGRTSTFDPEYTGEDEARFRWGKNRKW
jgi:hypothetical protein